MGANKRKEGAIMAENEYITRQEHEEFAKRIQTERERIDDEDKRQNKRLEALEESVKDIAKIASSVEKMALTMEHMAKEQEAQRKTLEGQGQKIDELKLEPGKKWNAIIYGVIGAVAAAIGAALMAGFLH